MNCKTCKHAIWDAKFGRFKCTKKTRIKTPGMNGTCVDYEKGAFKESKDNEAYYQEMDYKENEE